MRNSVVLLAVTLTLATGNLSADESHVAVVWNDFGADTGMLGAISASAPWDVTGEAIPVGMNSVLQSAFGKLFVLSAGDHTVRVVDPVSWTVEQSFQLNSGDTLVDLKVVSPQRAYVTRSNAAQLLQLDLTTGMTRESVDLTVFADNDGNPDVGTMVVHGDRMYVQLQRLNFDEPPPFPQPAIAVVDLGTEEIIDVDPASDGVQAIGLEGTFPKFKMQVVEETGKLIVSATGAFFDTGGIEVIDLGTLQTEGLAIQEVDANTGADLGAFIMVAPDRGFLVYSTDLLLSSHLHQFTLSGEVDPAELAVALDYFSPALAFDRDTDTVFMPIGGSVDNGLHAFDATTGARRSDRLIPIAGPPTDLIMLNVVPEPGTLAPALVAWYVLMRGATRRRPSQV